MKPMKANEPYRLSDKASSLLVRKAAARFQKARSKMQAADFDELNVLSACRTLYDGLESDNGQAFLELCQLVYRDTSPHGKKEPDWPLILAWLDEYDQVTKYVYAHEVTRKRAYAQEGVIASPTRRGKRQELQKAMRLWVRMSGQYCDILTDRTMVKAYQDAGVKYVMWVTEGDEKVCPVCRPLDGRIYPIGEAPKKQHWHCRCYLAPVDKNGEIVR